MAKLGISLSYLGIRLLFPRLAVCSSVELLFHHPFVGLIVFFIMAFTAQPNVVFGMVHYPFQQPYAFSQKKSMPQHRNESTIGYARVVQYIPPALPAAPQQLAALRTRGPEGERQTFVPIISLTERYDSNVLMGTNKIYDYVTSLSPGVRINANNLYVNGSLVAKVIADRYVRNPGLSYVGSSSVLALGLDNITGRLVRGWSLTINDSFRYTPHQPAFFSPEEGNEIPSAFVNGIQATRSNSLNNFLSVASSVSISSTASIATTYTNQILRFYPDASVPFTGGLFNVDANSISAGPQYNIAENHSIGLLYQYQRMAFSSAVSGLPVLDTTIQGAMFTWRGAVNPLLSFELGAGASRLSNDSSIQSTGRAFLHYTTPKFTASFSYTHTIAPSYFVAAGAVVSDLVNASIIYNVSRPISISSGYNYSKNRLTNGLFDFVSHGPNVALNYRAFQNVSYSLNYSYFTMVYGNSGVSVDVSRQVVALTLRAEWK